MGKGLFRYFLIASVLMLIFVGRNMFAVAPTVTDMVNLGQDIDYIARYIITHAAEFEPYMVEVAKVFIGSGVSGAITGAAALSTWSKFAAITAWGAVAGLATYDIVKGAQLIGALIELNDIKKGIVEVRNVQRLDQIGIQMMSNMGQYQEYYAVLSVYPTRESGGSVTYRFLFNNMKYYNGPGFVYMDEIAYFVAVYGTGGYKNVSTYLDSGSGPATSRAQSFLNGTGILVKAREIANNASYENRPDGVWYFKTPGWDSVANGSAPSGTSGSDEPLFSESQPVGVITTVNGASLLNALTPEEWGNVRSLQDIAPLLKFEYMPYSAYRNVPSYDDAPVEEVLIDTASLSVIDNPSVSPQTIEEIQQQLQILTQTVQSILSQMEQVQNIPELEQQVSELQQMQVEIAGLVETLSQTLQQVQTQTQTNTETIGILEEQYQTAVELMTAAQTALETLNQQTQQQYETINAKVQELDSRTQALSEAIQNISFNVDLSPVVQAVNEVSAKVDALTEEVQSLSEYLHEGFFEKLAEKVKEILEEMFVPDPEEVDAILDFDLPEYGKNFSAEFSFSSQSLSIPIQLFGTSVDLSRYITQYSAGLKNFMNIFVSALAAVFVVRAFRVHLNID